MGQEIHKAHFTNRDFLEFQHRLAEETDLLKQWFKDNVFECNVSRCGFELEAWLVDKDQKPTPQSLSFLENLQNPLVVPEVSLFNFEYNSCPRTVENHLLSQFHRELISFWHKAEKAAAEVDAEPVSIGVLPTLKKSDLRKKNFFPHKRYQALNSQLRKMRKHENINICVEGEDSLRASHNNLLIETVSTSLQIHLQLNANKAVRYYNTGILLAAPMVAIAANAPFLFQKSLWDETRIPVFEQVIDIEAKNNHNQQQMDRVTFGHGYVKESIFELFEENLHYAVLLPELRNTPINALSHLRIHNGTIWRWNRPIIDKNSQGVPHIRLEHRVAAAGTSTVDIIANIAFFLGFMREYAFCRTSPEEILSFAQAKKNFYQAAKSGLEAKVCWKGEKNIPLKQLILEELLPKAKKGLEKMQIDTKDINFYLDDIIRQRVETGMTGSAWQRQFMQNTKSTSMDSFCQLMQNYIQNQKLNHPVHRWPLETEV